jgi:hypothetical protein
MRRSWLISGAVLTSIVFALALTLTGCQQKPSAPPPPETATQPPETTPKPPAPQPPETPPSIEQPPQETANLHRPRCPQRPDQRSKTLTHTSSLP